ncbi:xanthine dehydrogenase family protein molybdopterin-binding subunit [Leeuwenhoekiella palythoae]|uniref:xanthine dehydrogenase family protein molybdopterin-binding subunit n=1 Tax=Leeuwenhoekiella palythoae TaxID=573501 RepID=UPI003513324B
MSKTITNTISRRTFFKGIGLGGTALCLGIYPGSATAAMLEETEEKDVALFAWVTISTSGKITMTCHRAEMGQGSYQSVAQILAEELEADLDTVEVVFAQGNREKYGSQITGGSSTIRGSYKKLLNLSASARMMLVSAAAQKWNVSATECYAVKNYVIHKTTGEKLHYGDLVEVAVTLPVPQEVELKDVSEYKLIRQPLKRKDTPLKTNGAAVFGLDKRVPGMVYATVERNPRLRGKLVSFDDSETRKVPGVQDVFKVEMLVFKTMREGVAVIADTTYAALEGRKRLKVEWDDTGFEHINIDKIFEDQEAVLQNDEGKAFHIQGNSTDVIAQDPEKLDVVYQTPYQSHSAMEPLNCVAHFQGDKIEVWGPIQAPEWVQDPLAEKYGIPRENVIVNMTFLGGGFGRKAFMDYPYEATVISEKIGKPVQVVWTREDDMRQGPYRPGISYRLEGSLKDGKIAAYKYRMAGQNRNIWRDPSSVDKPNTSTAEGLLKPYYKSIANLSISDVLFQTPIPVMWWRSVYASTNGFAFESFFDELAIKAGKDPLQFRKEHLQEEREQKLIDRMIAVSDWNATRNGFGLGAAITECFNTTVGQVVKVSKAETDGVKIDQVWAVIDCGWYVNPDIIQAQVEGAIVMALGAATIHEITFKDGLPQQNNFYDYKMPRITDIPPVEVFIMENAEDAGGVGEPGLPPFAPALTNAIYDLTKQRIRKLPFKLSEVEV